MPLRQLLTLTEKVARDLAHNLRSSLGPVLSDFHELSRPVRRRSHYPTLLAMHHGLEKVHDTARETTVLADYLSTRLQEILDYARREQWNRPTKR